MIVAKPHNNRSRWDKVRYRLKTLQRDAAWRLGAGQGFFKAGNGARILVYHGICQRDPLRYNTLFITLATFEAQLRLYKKHFNIISLDDFYHQRFSNERFNLCLTFDDGFANNYKYVLPLLEQYEVPATFFITAVRERGFDILWNDVLSIAHRHGPAGFKFMNETYTRNGTGRYISLNGVYLADMLRTGDFGMKEAMIKQLGQYKDIAHEDYWLQMTIEQVGELSKSKWVTVGSHGYYHNDLARVSEATLREELIKSRSFLENATGKAIRALAFPYGSYSRAAVDLAKQLGYSQILATDFIYEADAADTTMRERLTINPFISNINQAHANIIGHYR